MNYTLQAALDTAQKWHLDMWAAAEGAIDSAETAVRYSGGPTERLKKPIEMYVNGTCTSYQNMMGHQLNSEDALNSSLKNPGQFLDLSDFGEFFGFSGA